MARLNGYVGKVLRVNLTSGVYKSETLRSDLINDYLGGEGLGARILWDEAKPGIDPFLPDNVIIYAVGPLQGTSCPSASRACIVTKSPLTGGFTRTLAGGGFGYELKRSGYDVVIVEGRSANPVYLWIEENVTIRDADFLWGMRTGDTQKYVKNYTSQNAQVLCIGPAGEKLVRFACVISGIGAFGRGGAGAIMGSKNLKAIAVHGAKEVDVADPEDFSAAVKEAYTNFAGRKETAKEWREYGSVSMVNNIESHGNWPTRNFQEGIMPKARDLLYRAPWRKRMVKKDIACTLCPVSCKKVTYASSSGPFIGATSEGPEFEAIWSFGAQCGNADPDAITAADRYCDELGMDVISCGSTIGFAMELYQRKIITRKDTDGLILGWGNNLAMLEMVNRIGYGIGFGNLLSEGVKRAGEKIGKGAERYAIHVKGLELPAYDPRGQFGMGLNYATANRGACHCSGYTTYDELFGNYDRFATEGKAKLVIDRQNEAIIRNSAVLCSFGRWGTGDVRVKLLKAATGIDIDETILYKIGERIFNLERAFNIREGFTSEDDNLPERLLTEPLKRGPSKGHVVKLKPMLREYYRLRGWDEMSGIPTRRKLEELGLGDVARELEMTRLLT